MTTNWSLMFNIVSLVAVVFILVRILKKKQELILPMDKTKPNLNLGEGKIDDIIAIRKIDIGPVDDLTEPHNKKTTAPPPIKPPQKQKTSDEKKTAAGTNNSLMLFLLAKPQRQLAGYETLQSILAADLRFGDGSLFHQHQFENGQGPILFSLAAATPSGTFDLQNMGAFNAKGLCLFMHLSGSATIDTERLEQMLETAATLTENLDTYLLDNTREPFTAETKARYHRELDAYVLEQSQ